MSGDPTDLSASMWRTLLHLAGEKQPPRAHRTVMNGTTVRSLERRRLIEWEHTDQRTGWRLTDKGRFAVAWWRAQPKEYRPGWKKEWEA